MVREGFPAREFFLPHTRDVNRGEPAFRRALWNAVVRAAGDYLYIALIVPQVMSSTGDR
jgi:hypothetical protein